MQFQKEKIEQCIEDMVLNHPASILQSAIIGQKSLDQTERDGVSLSMQVEYMINTSQQLLYHISRLKTDLIISNYTSWKTNDNEKMNELSERIKNLSRVILNITDNVK